MNRSRRCGFNTVQLKLIPSIGQVYYCHHCHWQQEKKKFESMLEPEDLKKLRGRLRRREREHLPH